MRKRSLITVPSIELSSCYAGIFLLLGDAELTTATVTTLQIQHHCHWATLVIWREAPLRRRAHYCLHHMLIYPHHYRVTPSSPSGDDIIIIIVEAHFTTS